MTPQIKEWVRRRVGNLIPYGGNILELGSRNVNGTVRDLFDTTNYIGVDLEPGPCVDVAMEAAHFLATRHRYQYDLVICLEMLEHAPRFWDVVLGVHWALRHGGLFLVSAPTTGFPEHRFPVDCYRFMPDAFRDVFFEGMQVEELEEVKCPAGNPCLIGLGRKL